MQYRLSHEAEFDLVSIQEYVAADNPEAEARLIHRLFEAFNTLGTMPGIGHSRSDLTPLPVPFWPVGLYFVVYRTENEQVEIAAIVHGARDIPAFLDERS